MKRVLLLASAVAALAACGGDDGGGTRSVECSVFYRPAPAERFRTEVLRLDVDREERVERVARFADMMLAARLLASEFESSGLAVEVIAGARPVANALYQFPEQPLQNEFSGGHGFTGLVYAHHPTSAAEIQYFCRAL